MIRFYDIEDIMLLIKGRMIWVSKKKFREIEIIFYYDYFNKNFRFILKFLVLFIVIVS